MLIFLYVHTCCVVVGRPPSVGQPRCLLAISFWLENRSCLQHLSRNLEGARLSWAQKANLLFRSIAISAFAERINLTFGLCFLPLVRGVNLAEEAVGQ